ncbi:MAG: hypothetical protein CMP67_08150 [Flavobacteriales bacterium]|nr:hypothetical protein [Flavobacteriales bacterium]|tara:strand:- start:380 stop:1360 length:981 start_codon:yes stop_codon:yes gene_type:complete
MKNVVIFFLFIILFISCSEPSLIIDVSKSKSKLDFRHYEQDLFNINTENLETSLDQLAPKYPVFINGEYKDPTKLLELNDYLNNELNIKLFSDWNSKIGSYDKIKEKLNHAFSHYKHYFPKDSLPVIYTYISSVNYTTPVVVKNNEILIGIDLFYGEDYEIYSQDRIPKYLSKNYKKEYITPIVIRSFAKNKYSESIHGETLLENMIGLGKLEYFVEAMMPNVMDSIRFQFTTRQMIWCYSHEKSFWKHLALKEHLFSKDYRNYKKFIQHGPFVSSVERESPGRAGIFIGYRIIKEYMDNNPEVTLNELMTNKDFTTIFRDSKYNP